jgi:hypothetical protein
MARPIALNLRVPFCDLNIIVPQNVLELRQKLFVDYKNSTDRSLDDPAVVEILWQNS